MKVISLRAAGYICLALLLAQADARAQKNAPDAAAFLPVVSGGSSKIQQPKKVEVDSKKKIVEAATVQDAVNAAVKENKQDLKKAEAAAKASKTPEVGAHTIFVNGYLGFVATGVAPYQLVKNPTLSRISQRNAYITAFMMAKKNLARHLFGMSLNGKNEVREALATVSTKTNDLANLSTRSKQTLNQAVDAMLRGFVIYEVLDDDKQSLITVSVVTTPRTRGQLARPAPHRLKAKTLVEGISQVVDEVRNGLVPPVGGRIIEVPTTGETAFVGFGSTIVRRSENNALQQKLNLSAIRRADAFASDSLCGLIVGDRTSWEFGIRDSLTQEVKQYENTADDPLNPKETEIREFAKERESLISSSKETEVFRSARSGNLPPGIARRTWFDDDRAWAYGMAVYIPSATNAAAKAARETTNAKIIQKIRDGVDKKKKSPRPDRRKVKRPGDKVRRGVSGKADKKNL